MKKVVVLFVLLLLLFCCSVEREQDIREGISRETEGEVLGIVFHEKNYAEDP